MRFLRVNNNLPHIWHVSENMVVFGPIFAVDLGPLFNAYVRGEPLNSGLGNFA